MAIGGAAVVVGAVLWATLTDPKAEPEIIAADRFSSSSAREQGVVMGERFHQAIDGLDAIGVAGVKEPGSTAVWIVNRIASFYTIVVCTSDNTQDARTTCDPILSTLHWRAPGPL